jgi:hypothetical protein
MSEEESGGSSEVGTTLVRKSFSYHKEDLVGEVEELHLESCSRSEETGRGWY